MTELVPQACCQHPVSRSELDAARRPSVSDHSDSAPLDEAGDGRGDCERARGLKTHSLSRHGRPYRSAGANRGRGWARIRTRRRLRHAALDADAGRNRGCGPGAQWVAGQPDKILANAAQDVIAKIAAVVPEPMRPLIAAPGVGVRPRAKAPEGWIDASRLRQAVRKGLKVRLRYRSESEEETERTVWPVIVGYGEGTGTLIAWCELRQDFRHFRIDR